MLEFRLGFPLTNDERKSAAFMHRKREREKDRVQQGNMQIIRRRGAAVVLSFLSKGTLCSLLHSVQSWAKVCPRLRESRLLTPSDGRGFVHAT